MLGRIKKYFFSGLAIFLPLGLTIQVFLWALKFADHILGGSLRQYLQRNYNFDFPGFGILILVTAILFCGFLVTNYFGRVLHRSIDGLMMKIPLIATIYSAFKEIAQFFFQEKIGKIQQVVLIEWPRPGAYMIGFKTNATTRIVIDKVGKNLINVMIPHVPNPLTGFVVMLPDDLVKTLDMTVEEAFQIIVSGGVIDPHALSPDAEAPAKS